jgi:lipoyl(octanoyl) transferase
MVDFRRLALGTALTDYTTAWELQRQVHAAVSTGAAPATVLLLEHASVYTAGKRTEAHERPADGTPVIDVDRGGKITWHGPGQLVGYPIVRLPDHVMVVDFVRRMEEAMIRTMTDFGLTTGRVDGRSGVWLPADADLASGGRLERKIGAIGIRVAAQTTMHGIAINADTDMAAFGQIVPCGIADAGVTSIGAELGRPVWVVEVADVLEPHLAEMLAFEPYRKSPDLEPVAISGLVPLAG